MNIGPRRVAAQFAALTIAGAALAACGTSSGNDDGEVIELRYASQLSKTSSFGVQSEWWLKKVSDDTDGRVTFETFYEGSLAGPTELLPTLKSGRVDLAHLPVVYYPGELPLSQVIGIPFVTDNGAAAAKAYESMYESSAAFRDEYEEKHGVKVLAWSMVPSMAIGLPAPADGIDDLEGKKIRAVGLAAEALAARGVSPVALELSEVYESIERGVIDGWSGLPMAFAADQSLHEVAPNVVNTGIGVYAPVALVAIRMSVWEDLPEDIREVMLSAGKESLDIGIEATAETEAKACEAYLEKGGSVTVLSDGDVAAWRDDVQDGIQQQWVSAAEKAGVDRAAVDEVWKTYLADVDTQEVAVSYEEGMNVCAAEQS